MATAEFVTLLLMEGGENLLLLRMGFVDVNTDLENKNLIVNIWREDRLSFGFIVKDQRKIMFIKGYLISS